LAAAAALLQAMHPDGKGRVRLDYIIPARGLIASRRVPHDDVGPRPAVPRLRSLRPVSEREIASRQNGVMISNGQGTVLGYSRLQPAGARQADVRAR